MDSDPRTRTGKYGKKKNQDKKGKSQLQIGSGKGIRAKEANMQRAIENQKNKSKQK